MTWLDKTMPFEPKGRAGPEARQLGLGPARPEIEAGLANFGLKNVGTVHITP